MDIIWSRQSGGAFSSSHFSPSFARLSASAGRSMALIAACPCGSNCARSTMSIFSLDRSARNSTSSGQTWSALNLFSADLAQEMGLQYIVATPVSQGLGALCLRRARNLYCMALSLKKGPYVDAKLL